MSNRLQWWWDEHFWKWVYLKADNRMDKKPLEYTGFWYALKEASWNRVCGGPQSAWHIFKIAMGWTSVEQNQKEKVSKE